MLLCLEAIELLGSLGKMYSVIPSLLGHTHTVITVSNTVKLDFSVTFTCTAKKGKKRIKESGS